MNIFTLRPDTVTHTGLRYLIDIFFRFEPVLKAVDPRIPSCIADFLETKMRKYAKQFSWRFAKSDFDATRAVDADIELTAVVGGEGGWTQAPNVDASGGSGGGSGGSGGGGGGGGGKGNANGKGKGKGMAADRPTIPVNEDGRAVFSRRELEGLGVKSLKKVCRALSVKVREGGEQRFKKLVYIECSIFTILQH